MEKEQDVRLEIAAAVEVDAHRVMRLVQELKDIPPDAWCEVRNVWSTRPNTTHATTTTTMVQMVCAHCVADFLCQRFAKQARHVSQGEVLLVRCRRVHLRSLPAAGSNQCMETSGKQASSLTSHFSSVGLENTDGKRRPTALSRATMVDLLDCLGDQIVDVLDAFQASSEPGENEGAQLTMIGLVQALEKLSKQDWTMSTNFTPKYRHAEAKPLRKSNSKSVKDTKTEPIDRLVMHKIRHLLTQLIAHGAVALPVIPEKNDVPFMVYTDFIACYVAYMNSSPQAS